MCLSCACAEPGPAPIVSADTQLTDLAPVAPTPDVLADLPDVFDEPDLAEPPDTGPPPPAPSLWLTVEGIPVEMNGSLPYVADNADAVFRLRVNAADFTLDLTAEGQVDWETLELVCDGELAGVEAGVPVPLALFSGEPEGRRLHVSSAALGTTTCSATVSGPGGEANSELSFDVANLPAHLDPFAADDVWLVTLSRDLFEVIRVETADGYSLESTYLPQGNGQDDFSEALTEIGLMHPDAPEAGAWLFAALLAEIRADATRIFGLSSAGKPTPDGVRIELFFEGDEGAPLASDYDTGAFSMMAMGGDGDPDDIADGIVGRAAIDWNNQAHENNTFYGRGVFVTALIRTALKSPITTGPVLEFLPGVGTPFGLHPADALIMAPDFDLSTTPDKDASRRGGLITLALRLAGRGISATLCHEMGHSLGLVPYGPPPQGLFAEVNADFLVSQPGDAHTDTVGINVMQTGKVTNYGEAVAQPAEFNALNWAYLRRRIVVGETVVGE